MSAISIKIDYVNLAIAINNLKSLEDGTGYDKSYLSESLSGCIGLAADKNRELFISLFKIEELLIEIVKKTQVALQNAGVKFSESEDMISSIFDVVGTISNSPTTNDTKVTSSQP
ncbi:MAG: hypothetical protein RR012_08540 [Oscillospiraceae bacterium]